MNPKKGLARLLRLAYIPNMSALSEYLDPTRSHWQRARSPLKTDVIQQMLHDLDKMGIPLEIGSILKILLRHVDAFNDPDHLRADYMTTAMLLHAQAKAQRAGWPLYVLDRDAAVALAETALPDTAHLGDVRLPHEGLYVRKRTRLNSSHAITSRMPASA